MKTITTETNDMNEKLEQKYVLPSGILHSRIVEHRDIFKIKVYFVLKVQ